MLLFPLAGSIAWLVAGRPQGAPGRSTYERQVPDFPEYDRPGRAAATQPADDEEFLRKVRERAEEQRRAYREEPARPGARGAREAAATTPATRRRRPADGPLNLAQGSTTFEHMSEQTTTETTTDPGTDSGTDSGTEHTETLGSPTPESGAVRDPEEWVTGDEPMTGPQRSYLDNLARQAGEEIPADLTKAEASEHIERLQQLNATQRPAGDVQR